MTQEARFLLSLNKNLTVDTGQFVQAFLGNNFPDAQNVAVKALIHDSAGRVLNVIEKTEKKKEFNLEVSDSIHMRIDFSHFGPDKKLYVVSVNLACYTIDKTTGAIEFYTNFNINKVPVSECN